jgi:hypothetical protein
MNIDIFAWKPSDMLDIPREVTEHALKIKTGSKPVKQCLRRFDEEKRRAIDEEIAKLLVVGFVKEAFGGQIRQGSQSYSCMKKEWEKENVC